MLEWCSEQVDQACSPWGLPQQKTLQYAEVELVNLSQSAKHFAYFQRVIIKGITGVGGGEGWGVGKGRIQHSEHLCLLFLFSVHKNNMLAYVILTDIVCATLLTQRIMVVEMTTPHLQTEHVL